MANLGEPWKDEAVGGIERPLLGPRPWPYLKFLKGCPVNQPDAAVGRRGTTGPEARS